MNSSLVQLTRGRSVAHIAIVILGIALATGPEALGFGGGRFAGGGGGGGGGRFGGGGGGYHPSSSGARITSAVMGLAAET
jgi:hypothetical protein